MSEEESAEQLSFLKEAIPEPILPNQISHDSAKRRKSSAMSIEKLLRKPIAVWAIQGIFMAVDIVIFLVLSRIYGVACAVSIFAVCSLLLWHTYRHGKFTWKWITLLVVVFCLPLIGGAVVVNTPFGKNIDIVHKPRLTLEHSACQITTSEDQPNKKTNYTIKFSLDNVGDETAYNIKMQDCVLCGGDMTKLSYSPVRGFDAAGQLEPGDSAYWPLTLYATYSINEKGEKTYLCGNPIILYIRITCTDANGNAYIPKEDWSALNTNQPNELDWISTEQQQPYCPII
ncbi:MAG: hypothetical protein ABSA18_07030 [Dehalococcoidia bacterium]|jgi:hypothetical protein